MLYPSPDQPRSVKTINKIGRILRSVGLRRPSLNPDKLIALAKERTGLADFGGDSFRPGLQQLVQSLEDEARLSLIGRFAARSQLVENLITRLHLTNYRKLRPEVAQQQIARPLFVLGLPRTGTTILYELLAQDPMHRAPLSWEVQEPIPPAQAANFYTDPRIATVEKQLAQAEILAPGFNAIHEIGAQLPQECVAIMGSHFISESFSTTFFLPSYRRWMLAQDMSETLRWHTKFLQHLQVDYKKPRWVLKTPFHLACVDALVKQYPDAAIVQTHRAPMEVMGSVTSLACTLHSAFSDDIDPYAEGNYQAAFFSELINRGMAQRAALPDGDSRFYDIDFKEIISDPVAAIEKMYCHFKFDFTEEARTAMQNYIANRPRDKHGKHHYTLEQFGLSHEQHGPLFENYCKRFGL